MASAGTNAAVRRLHDRQSAQLRAVRGLEVAAGRVTAAQERRAVVVAELDAAVAAARAGRDVAVAVLADLLGEDGAAEVTDVAVADVRAARRRADPAAVRAATEAAHRPERRGRQRAGESPGGRPSAAGG